jgi:hypothetical protein
LGPPRLQVFDALGLKLEHFLGGLFGRDDLGIGDKLVAEGVVAVGMGVDECLDLSCRRHLVPHLVEHFPGQFEIEQRIDQKILVAIDDQSRVAPTPAAIGL